MLKRTASLGMQGGLKKKENLNQGKQARGRAECWPLKVSNGFIVCYYNFDSKKRLLHGEHLPSKCFGYYIALSFLFGTFNFWAFNLPSKENKNATTRTTTHHEAIKAAIKEKRLLHLHARKQPQSTGSLLLFCWFVNREETKATWTSFRFGQVSIQNHSTRRNYSWQMYRYRRIRSWTIWGKVLLFHTLQYTMLDLPFSSF